MAEKYGDVKALSLNEKIQHYFHYYWKLAAGIGVVLVVFFAGLISTLRNEDYDTSILLATRGKQLQAESEFVTRLSIEVEKYAVDTDGNGEVNVLLDSITFPSGSEDSASDAETACQTRLEGELELGDSQMYIMDYEIYNSLKDLGGFIDLTEIFPDRDIPLVTAIPLNETVLYDTEFPCPEAGLDPGQTLQEYWDANREVMDDLVICFRRDDDLKPARREVQYELFLNIINAGYPENTPEE